MLQLVGLILELCPRAFPINGNRNNYYQEFLIKKFRDPLGVHNFTSPLAKPWTIYIENSTELKLKSAKESTTKVSNNGNNALCNRWMLNLNDAGTRAINYLRNIVKTYMPIS